MLYRGSCLFFFCLVTIFYTHGQDGQFEFGGRSAAMANSSVSLGDAYSVFNNVGAMAAISETQVFMGYRLPYGLVELNSIAAGFVKPLKYGNAGLSFYRFGGKSLNQQKISLGFSNKYGLVSLGANVTYLQYKVESIGSAGSVLIEFGGVAELTKVLRFGAHVFNLNRAKLTENENDRIPMVMKAGLSFRPGDELIINLEVKKSLDTEAQLRMGLEYYVIENLALRTGIETNPVKGAFGVGFVATRFMVDYAYSNHSILSDIHDFSIGMKF